MTILCLKSQNTFESIFSSSVTSIPLPSTALSTLSNLSLNFLFSIGKDSSFAFFIYCYFHRTQIACCNDPVFSEYLTYEAVCGRAGIPPEHFTAEEWFEKGSEPINRVTLWCINTEILDPFIYIFAVMWIVCWVNGWLEGRSRS